MKGIYNIRTLFEKYYSEYGNYIDAAAKFVTALILFMQINGRIGGKSIFGNIFVELILALICAILPPNVMIVLAFVAALLQFASVSIASLAVGGGVLLAVLLLYFAFASRQAWAMLLTILGLFFHVPCIVPIITKIQTDICIDDFPFFSHTSIPPFLWIFLTVIAS